MPLTFSGYIARQFLFWFGAFLIGLLSIIFLLETVELLRRASGLPHVTFGTVLQLALLKIPLTAQRTVPFAVLFSAMFCFWRMTRTQELVVARAAGISAWKFLAPAIVVAALIGIIWTAAVNPVGATLSERFERMEAEYLQGRSSAIKVSPGGLWLRQSHDGGETILRAESIDPSAQAMANVTVFRFDETGGFASRIDAAEAYLSDGDWYVREAVLNAPQRRTTNVTDQRVLEDLPLSRIEENFVEPEALSFWKLPGFIAALEATGFSSLRHRIHYESMLARPLLLAAMVLLAAAFSLRLQRRGGTGLLIAAGLLTGLALYAFSDFAMALGVAERIPVALAAWTPAAVALLLGAAGLLHAEGG